ncbi:MAG: hypothetical protein IJP62_01010 [Treponema sp.]|nr:hypothetical protein [Treponema sp.]
MEPRTRILFISYIIIVLAIVAIGVVPYFVRGDYKSVPEQIERPASFPNNRPTPMGRIPDRPAKTSSVFQAEFPPAKDMIVGTIHVIDTNKKTKSVRFQIPMDGVYFEEQNDHLYEIMKNKNGRDIKLSYQKISKNNEVLYNFENSIEIR